MKSLRVVAAFISLCWTELVLAQEPSSNAAAPSSGEGAAAAAAAAASNGDWMAFLQNEGLTSFVLDASLIIFLSALIAFHPSIARKRDTLEDVELPKTILSYGLVGMVVGFLVVRYGPEIGFVVFGIGTLIRFRTDVGSSKDTGRVILVTLTGLCVGLGLPHIAILTVATAWVLIAFVERRNLFKITIRPIEEGQNYLVADSYTNALKQHGYNIVRIKTVPLKRQVEILFETPKQISQPDIEKQFASTPDLPGKGQIDWELI